MKIRTDFITNSSSTSFPLAAIQVVEVLAGTALVIQAVYAANKAASGFADADVVRAAPDAPLIRPGSTDPAAMVERFRLTDADDLKSMAEKEIEAEHQLSSYQKLYAEFKSGAFAGDPEEAVRAEDSMQAFIEYLRQKLDQIAGARYSKIVDDARTAAETDAMKEWIASKKIALKEVQDEQAFLRSGAVDGKIAEDMLKDAAGSEEELRRQIAQSGGSADTAGPVQGADAMKTFDADSTESVDFNRLNDARKKEIDELESAKETGAAPNGPSIEALQSRQDALRRDIRSSRESEAGWEYMSRNAGISHPIASSSLNTGSLSVFSSHSAKSWKDLFSGVTRNAAGQGTSADGLNIPPEVMKWIRKGLFNFVNSKFGGKYASQLKNLFSLSESILSGDADLSAGGADLFSAVGTGALKGTLEIAKSDILTNSFSSIAVDHGDVKPFSWKDLMDRVRSGKPLKKAVKSGLSAEEDRGKRVKGENVRLNLTGKGF